MASQIHRWTRADLERMPDDGNHYEVVDGELLVTPAPHPAHWALVTALRSALDPYCIAEGLGTAGENAPFVADDSEVIPDLVVRRMPVPQPADWADVPAPVLIIEVISPSTRRNDEVKKRRFYVESGIPEYWIVDGASRSIRVITAGGDRVESAVLCWQPIATSPAFELSIPDFFEKALGRA